MLLKDIITQHINITEAFDSDVDYKVVTKRHDLFATEAKIGERKIHFLAMEEDEDEGDGWDVSFYQTDLDNKNKIYTLSGDGDELKVFSMARASMEQFIKDYSPYLINARAPKLGGKSRADMFEKMIQRVAGSKYKIARQDIQGTVAFNLTRK